MSHDDHSWETWVDSVQSSQDAEIEFIPIANDDLDVNVINAECKKCDDHRNFVPFNNFTKDSLPEDYRDEDDLFQLIRAFGELTVRIKVHVCSEKRPKFTPEFPKGYPPFADEGETYGTPLADEGEIYGNKKVYKKRDTVLVDNISKADKGSIKSDELSDRRNTYDPWEDTYNKESDIEAIKSCSFNDQGEEYDQWDEKIVAESDKKAVESCNSNDQRETTVMKSDERIVVCDDFNDSMLRESARDDGHFENDTKDKANERFKDSMVNSPQASFGSGRIQEALWYDKRFDHPCPCEECGACPHSKREWGLILVRTATHVVFNAEEAKSTTCLLGYETKGSRCAVIKGFDTTAEPDVPGDTCVFDCYTHSKVLFDKIEQMIKRYKCLQKKVASKFEKKTGDKKLVVIVSHPHGLNKQVTVGEWSDKGVKCYETWYQYNSVTCPGSSGGPVFILSRLGRLSIHPHSKVAKDNKNSSGSGLG
ncbi:uncharacterized protein LOC131935640 [Physella acuta]|uniref:uncharacterized protein LOC131935640 n=1 Tax=Physella acuta TaxID=109671 RepID=UPI0027DE59D7|nr:uncharacterized protein LOC131935640 [Physella acuta]XP_059148131.1 uncharacterized protein LOC131935640 [Physella acuta]XP_059148132.1 uncharacterized protein LOC131935640 [Physella acuta]